MKYFEFLFVAIIFLSGCQQSKQFSNPLGDPIHMGDPFVLLDDQTYYLYGTTGGKGFKVWRSSDFAKWEEAGTVFAFDSARWGKKSFWAPEVIKYQQRYYMTYSSSGPLDSVGFRLGLAVSDQPEGPFRDLYVPWIDLGWSAIDAHIFVDDDHIPYLFFDKVGVIEDPWHLYGIIYMVQLSDNLSEAITEPKLVVQAEQDWEAIDRAHPSSCNEGAFVFKYHDLYYLTYSAGHYLSPKYAIGYATADSPFGPWIKGNDNPLVQKDLSLGISGPGHNSITWSPDRKEMFIVYHVHYDPENPSGDRQVFIDRIHVSEERRLKFDGPVRGKQPVPSGIQKVSSDK
jgi:beta-xylosidase